MSVLREWIDFSANKKSSHDRSFLLSLKQSRKYLLKNFFPNADRRSFFIYTVSIHINAKRWLKKARGNIFLSPPFQSIATAVRNDVDYGVFYGLQRIICAAFFYMRQGAMRPRLKIAQPPRAPGLSLKARY